MLTNYFKIKLGILLAFCFLCLIPAISISQEKGIAIKDIDGNVYRTVKIGSQLWMRDNLKVIHYNNGDLIETQKPDTIDLTNAVHPKFQWSYQSNDSLVNDYGRLYTWYVVADNRKICPLGWHIPTDEEFCILENFIEENTDVNCNKEDHRGKFIGNYMKEAGHEHWGEPETGADNRSGFTGLPAGIRYLRGVFTFLGQYTYYWTSTEVDSKKARTRRLYHDETTVSRSHYFKKDAISVRCVKDSE